MAWSFRSGLLHCFSSRAAVWLLVWRLGEVESRNVCHAERGTDSARIGAVLVIASLLGPAMAQPDYIEIPSRLPAILLPCLFYCTSLSSHIHHNVLPPHI